MGKSIDFSAARTAFHAGRKAGEEYRPHYAAHPKLAVVAPDHLACETTKFDVSRLPLKSPSLGPRADFAEYRDIATLKHAELQAGDVLIRVCEDRDPTHRLIMAGQRYEAMRLGRANGGSSYVTHAALYLGDTSDAEFAAGMLPISESQGGERKIALNANLRPGNYRVYRFRDSELAQASCRTAKIWGSTRSIRYNTIGAARSIFRSRLSAAQLQRKIENYAAGAHETDPGWARKGAFCSEYVLASYQAAAGTLKKPIDSVLRNDPEHMTPKGLDRAFRAAPHEVTRVGNIRVSGNSVAYDEHAATLAKAVHGFQPHSERLMFKMYATVPDSYREIETGAATKEYDALLHEVKQLEGQEKFDLLSHLAFEIRGLETKAALARVRDLVAYCRRAENGDTNGRMEVLLALGEKSDRRKMRRGLSHYVGAHFGEPSIGNRGGRDASELASRKLVSSAMCEVRREASSAPKPGKRLTRAHRAEGNWYIKHQVEINNRLTIAHRAEMQQRLDKLRANHEAFLQTIA